MERLKGVTRLFEDPVILHMGTCDSNLKPYSTRVTGGFFAADAGKMTVFIVESSAALVLDHLSHHETAAIIAVNPITYESYQLKGQYLSVRECTVEDYRVQDQFFERLKLAAFPERFYKMKMKPSVALSFAVTDVYYQSPGPHAGNLVYHNLRIEE